MFAFMNKWFMANKLPVTSYKTDFIKFVTDNKPIPNMKNM